MAKKTLSGGYDLAGTKKRKRAKGRKSAKAPKGFKVATASSCLKGKKRLKKGCIWGRGRFKGKLLRKTKKAA